MLKHRYSKLLFKGDAMEMHNINNNPVREIESGLIDTPSLRSPVAASLAANLPATTTKNDHYKIVVAATIANRLADQLSKVREHSDHVTVTKNPNSLFISGAMSVASICAGTGILAYNLYNKLVFTNLQALQESLQNLQVSTWLPGLALGCIGYVAARCIGYFSKAQQTPSAAMAEAYGELSNNELELAAKAVEVGLLKSNNLSQRIDYNYNDGSTKCENIWNNMLATVVIEAYQLVTKLTPQELVSQQFLALSNNLREELNQKLEGLNYNAVSRILYGEEPQSVGGDLDSSIKFLRTISGALTAAISCTDETDDFVKLDTLRILSENLSAISIFEDQRLDILLKEIEDADDEYVHHLGLGSDQADTEFNLSPSDDQENYLFDEENSSGELLLEGGSLLGDDRDSYDSGTDLFGAIDDSTPELTFNLDDSSSDLEHAGFKPDNVVLFPNNICTIEFNLGPDSSDDLSLDSDDDLSLDSDDDLSLG